MPRQRRPLSPSFPPSLLPSPSPAALLSLCLYRSPSDIMQTQTDTDTDTDTGEGGGGSDIPLTSLRHNRPGRDVLLNLCITNEAAAARGVAQHVCELQLVLRPFLELRLPLCPA